MGKSKKRIFNKNTDNKGMVLKRKEVISNILLSLKSNKITDETKNLISLFGISMEELFEAGAEYEDMTAVKHLFSFQ